MEDTKGEITIIGEPFYYPQTGRWYQFIDMRIDGELSSRVCKTLPMEMDKPIIEATA